MTFTYASTDPGGTDLSWVRMRVADTSSGSYRLEDEEINALLDTEGNKYLAAAVAAETIGATFAGKVDKQVGKLRISMAQASGHYFNLAKRLRHENTMRAEPFAGGISADDKKSTRDDSDRVDPAFAVEMFDHEGLVDASTGEWW